MVRFANGKDAIIDVCRQAPYLPHRPRGLNPRWVRDSGGMGPGAVRVRPARRGARHKGDDDDRQHAPLHRSHPLGQVLRRPRRQAARLRPSPPLRVSQSWVVTGHADMPYDFFMSRYKEAYKQETLAFVRALRRDEPAPCSGRDGLVALIMAIGAGISAEEGRWVRFEEVLQREGIGGMRVSEEGGETAGGGAGWISTMLGSVTPSANPRKEDDLREIFLLFDTDDDDLLTEKEVGEATKLLCKDGACPIYTAEEVHSMVRGVDSDRDGRITFDEFLALWRRAGNIEGAAEEANPFAKLLAPLLK
mmetsp:Transcript_4342/g.13098  ORF Transcript_4342/g.13098 Transcript_4342/m.13098 type:complete len:305 (-) Transcript_4342:147-1061(-)